MALLLTIIYCISTVNANRGDQTVNYATQIKRTSSAWIPGIYRKQTKQQAVDFANGVNKTGGQAVVLKFTPMGTFVMNDNGQWDHASYLANHR